MATLMGSQGGERTLGEGPLPEGDRRTPTYSCVGLAQTAVSWPSLRGRLHWTDCGRRQDPSDDPGGGADPGG